MRLKSAESRIARVLSSASTSVSASASAFANVDVFKPVFSPLPGGPPALPWLNERQPRGRTVAAANLKCTGLTQNLGQL